MNQYKNLTSFFKRDIIKIVPESSFYLNTGRAKEKKNQESLKGGDTKWHEYMEMVLSLYLFRHRKSEIGIS